MGHLIKGFKYTLLALLFSTKAYGSSEEARVNEILNRVTHNQYNQRRFFQVSSFNGQNDFRIHFLKFGFETGLKGSVVISPGRVEMALKYSELADDLINQGFSPIFVIDHRGQGYSSRALKNRHKGHVSDFRFYYADFDRFIEFVLEDSKTNGENLFLISHSMGGAIAVGYLQNFNSPFKKIVLSAPMLKIKLNKSEEFVLRETWFSCYVLSYIPFSGFPGCDDYIPDGGDYHPNKEVFEGNDLTSSSYRYFVKKRILDVFPLLALGSPTMKWVRESIRANLIMRSPEEVRKIDKPILILQADQDTVVDNSGQNEFCSKLSHHCNIVRIENALHEILMERDVMRNEALQKILAFLN